MVKQVVDEHGDPKAPHTLERRSSQEDPEAEKDYVLLKRRIFKDTSLDCQQYKNNYLRRRLKVRMRSVGVSTYGEYLQVINRDVEEYEVLLNDITINVTHFFRDLPVFELLEEEIIPLLVYDKVKNKRKVIRVWSAGCSSGEEAYSLAIILHHMLGEEFQNFIVSIHGNDIDDASLKRAKAGIYTAAQLENVRKELLEEYFHFDGENYRVIDEIKRMTRFKKQDLFLDIGNKHFDLVLCRNVVIYFTKEMQKKLFMNFYDSLNYGGYLVIGKTETLVGESKDRFHVVNGRERIYQKLRE